MKKQPPLSIKELIRTIPDFPKPGIQFRDITTLLNHPQGFQTVIQELAEKYRNHTIDHIVGIESRGFIIGAPLALELNVGFVPVRKPGKLPGKTIHAIYELEYGRDELHVHTDAIAPGARVLIVDDLLATGGTLAATCRLMGGIGADITGCACVIELPTLNGRQKLADIEVFSLVSFEGD